MKFANIKNCNAPSRQKQKFRPDNTALALKDTGIAGFLQRSWNKVSSLCQRQGKNRLLYADDMSFKPLILLAVQSLKEEKNIEIENAVRASFFISGLIFTQILAIFIIFAWKLNALCVNSDSLAGRLQHLFF